MIMDSHGLRTKKEHAAYTTELKVLEAIVPMVESAVGEKEKSSEQIDLAVMLRNVLIQRRRKLSVYEKRYLNQSSEDVDPDKMRGGRKRIYLSKNTALALSQPRDCVAVMEEEHPVELLRPMRKAYVHQACKASMRGGVTRLTNEIARKFAENPTFYTHAFCGQCCTHRPVSEFVWENTTEKVGI